MGGRSAFATPAQAAGPALRYTTHMRHAIFGASSLLGTHLMRRLIGAGEEVMAYDADPDLAGQTPVPIHRCDPDIDLREPEQFFGIESIDVAYWVVKSPPFRQFPIGAGKLFSVNVAGPVRMAEAVAAAGAKVLIHVSSGTLYAPSWSPIPETGQFQGMNPYALTAIAAENALHLVHAAKPRLTMACLRVFGLFGPGQGDGLVPGLIKKVSQAQAISLPPHPDDKDTDANGLQLSVTYVDDAVACVEAVLRAALGRQLRDKVLNIASAQPTSIRRLAELIGRELHLVPHYDVPDRPRDGELIADLSRLSGYLPVPSTPLEVALAATVAAARR